MFLRLVKKTKTRATGKKNARSMIDWRDVGLKRLKVYNGESSGKWCVYKVEGDLDFGEE